MMVVEEEERCGLLLMAWHLPTLVWEGRHKNNIYKIIVMSLIITVWPSGNIVST